MVKSFTNGIENIIVGTERGQIKVFAMPPLLHQEMAFDTFNAHLGEVVKIIASPDGRYVFSAGADGSIFVYSVTEYINEATILK
jgi:WD40 repeat protein